MRSIIYNKKGVSNILGYIFSFGVASMLMVSAVLITTGILDNKTAAVAGMQAQSVANKIADAVVEAIAVLQSPSNVGYKKTLDVPMDLAGRDYYVDVTDTMIYVNTTDGLVSKSCPTYTVEDLKIGVGGGRTYCGGIGKINVSVDKSDTLYKLDFGTGNLTKHSPVASGYYFVSNETLLNPNNPLAFPRDPPWWNTSYTNRVPILINNTSPYDLVNVPVKVVLNTSNFDYNHANVIFAESSSNVKSDLVFNDPSDNVMAKIEITPKEWEPGWFYTYYDPGENMGTVKVTIKEISGGYDVSYIKDNTIRLNGNAKPRVWSVSNGVGTAEFGGKEAMESLENGKHFLKPGYTVTVSGLLKNGIEFYGSGYISIKNAVYVRPTDPGNSIQNAIDKLSSSGGTVFVYNGNYIGTDDKPGLEIKKPLNLIGESRDKTIFNIKKDDEIALAIYNANSVNIDSFWIYPELPPNCFPMEGILAHNCDHINITNCRINGTIKGVKVESSQDVSISNCLTHEMVMPSDGSKHGNGIAVKESKHVRITNCETYYLNTSNGDGFDIRSSEYVDVIKCISHDHKGDEANGVKIIASNYCNVIDCRFYNLTGNGSSGVVICADGDGIPSKYNVVRGCVIYGNNASGGPSLAGRGVYIADAGTDNNTIENCIIYRNRIGIQATTIIAYNISYIISGDLNGFLIEGPCSHNNILNCSIYENLNIGIAFFHMLGNTISNCSVYNNGIDPCMGEWINNSCGILLVASGKNTIKNCSIYNNGDPENKGGCGIVLIFAGWNTIEHCNIYGNIKGSKPGSGDGIKLTTALDFFLTGCGFNRIRYCNSFDNGRDGIELNQGTIGNEISNCNLYRNGEKGVYISQDSFGFSNLNYINNSNFEENGVNACDEAVVNSWNGNFWDDWDSNCGYDEYYCIPPGYCGPFGACWGSKDDNPQSTRNPNPAFFQVNASYGSGQTHFYNTTSIKTAMQNMDTMGVGGTVKVYAGTYVEGIAINQANVKLIGEGDVIVIGSSEDPGPPPSVWSSDVISVNNYDVSIEGLTIKDGQKGIKYTNTLSSGGLPLRIKNCKIESNSQEGIYLGGNNNNYCIINNCTIQNNKYGIYVGTNNNKIIDCTIKDNNAYTNSYGVKIHGGDSNIFTNCNLSNNKIGFQIESSSNNNIIDNSKISDHANQGIKISGSSNNKISNCTINDNAEGIYIDSSDLNNIINSNISGSTSGSGIEIKESININITYCNIYDNDCGIYILDNFEGVVLYKNNITNCNIYDNNNYGVRTQTTSGYNKIYHNNFKNTNNAKENGPAYNTWDNGYPSGGNLWSDYDEEIEGAKDYYKGPSPQTESGSDGIADLPYTKNGVNDRYPFCRRNPSIPYFIDYWNPYGDSVILVNTSVKAYSSKCIVLYYGYDGPLDKIHNHTMREISLFFDDFLGTAIDNNKWLQVSESTGKKYNVRDGFISFSDGGNITTKDFAIPSIGDPTENLLSSTTNESIYIVEAKMKINKGQGNMILLSFTVDSEPNYYLISANVTPSNILSLHKSSDPRVDQLDNAPASNLSHWLRMKSYIYLSKTHYPTPGSPDDYSKTNATFLKNYVYDIDTFADLSSVSSLDTWSKDVSGGNWQDLDGEAAQGEPYPYSGKSGKIGLGCGLLSSEDSSILVDWIRVMKAPVVQPTVTVGCMESINYGWQSTTNVKAWNSKNSDPFELTSPVLCDFNYGSSSSGGPEIAMPFVIKDLPAGRYTITVTKGNYTNITDPLTVTASEPGSTKKGIVSLTIPATAYGKFETKWFTIYKADDGPLNIVFSATDNKWLVNSLIIDRGAKGVKVGWE